MRTILSSLPRARGLDGHLRTRASSLLPVTPSGGVLHTRFSSGPSSYVEGSLNPEADYWFPRLFGGTGGGSWINTVLPDNSTVHASSATIMTEFQRQLDPVDPYTYWNTTSWTSNLNVVAPGTARHIVTATENMTNSYGAPMRAMLREVGVPIPMNRDGTPAITLTSDSDAELAIYDPETDDLWEFWHLQWSRAGGFTASWGGRMRNATQNLVGHWRDVNISGDEAANIANASDPDVHYEDHNWGAQATSIPLFETMMDKRSFREGVIRHVLHYEAAAAPYEEQADWVWPGQRRDGASRIVMPQGTRVRFPHDVTVAGTDLQKIFIRCIRDYGIVFADTVGSSTGITFRGEIGLEAYLLELGLIDGSFSSNAFMRSLPWDEAYAIAVGSDGGFTPTS